MREQLERDERIRLQQEREEQARIERAMKQQEYNGALIEAFNQEQPIEFELVLETHPQTGEILIDAFLFLVIHMKPHQSKQVIHYFQSLMNHFISSRRSEILMESSFRINYSHSC